MASDSTTLGVTTVGTPVLAGPLAAHDRACEFAKVVQRVHHRYANEVVGAFSLCPFMNDAESAFGRFCVMLDTQLDLQEALRMVAEAGVQVVHLVYPLVDVSAAAFERFGGELHKLVEQSLPSPPVHATFHPNMAGDADSAPRLVGLLRHSPDPFIQFVPEGLHKGGTAFFDPTKIDIATWLAEANKSRKASLFERTTKEQIARIVQLQRDIRRDRDASYAEYLELLCRPAHAAMDTP